MTPMRYVSDDRCDVEAAFRLTQSPASGLLDLVVTGWGAGFTRLRHPQEPFQRDAKNWTDPSKSDRRMLPLQVRRQKTRARAPSRRDLAPRRVLEPNWARGGRWLGAIHRHKGDPHP